jgi:hypothetical protein
MTKRLKAVCGVLLAAAALLGAAEARADISIGVGIEGYMPASNARAAELRAAQLEKLSGTVASLNESAGRDSGKTEVLLAGLYSGTVNSGAAAGVYVEPGPSVLKKEAGPEPRAAAAVEPVQHSRKEAAVKSESKDAEAAPEEKPVSVNTYGSSEKKAGSAGAFLGNLAVLLLLLLLIAVLL